MRLLVHAGFHKTGTSSVQRFLRDNRKALAPEFRILLPRDVRPATEAARGYSLAQDPLELGLFTYEMAQLLTSLDPTDPRPVVITAEDLAGHMPGRNGLTHYAATATLMKALVGVAKECIPTVHLQFYFSTRAIAAWIDSCHGQHLRASRMTEDAETYQQRYFGKMALAATLEEISNAVAPHRVTSLALEETQNLRFGPTTPLLTLMAPTPQKLDQLAAVSPSNAALSAEVLAQFLALNQSPLDDSEVKAQKQSILTKLGLE